VGSVSGFFRDVEFVSVVVQVRFCIDLWRCDVEFSFEPAELSVNLIPGERVPVFDRGVGEVISYAWNVVLSARDECNSSDDCLVATASCLVRFDGDVEDFICSVQYGVGNAELLAVRFEQFVTDLDQAV